MKASEFFFKVAGTCAVSWVALFILLAAVPGKMTSDQGAVLAAIAIAVLLTLAFGIIAAIWEA